jgi:hypothetical protein
MSVLYLEDAGYVLKIRITDYSQVGYYVFFKDITVFTRVICAPAYFAHPIF